MNETPPRRLPALILGFAGTLLSASAAAQIPARTVFTSAGTVGQVDVAYAPEVKRHLCVWQEEIAPATGQIRGLFLDPDGFAAGAPFTIGSFLFGRHGALELAYVAAHQRFVVVWGMKEMTRMASVHAVTGDLSPTSSPVPGSPSSYRLGGDISRSLDYAILVGVDGDERVYVQQLELDSVGGVRVTAEQTVDSNGQFPSISKTAGVAGRHLIAWRVPAGGPVQAIVLESDFGLRGPVTITTALAFAIEIDGDGRNWTVVTDSAGLQCYSVGYDAVAEEPYVRGDPTPVPYAEEPWGYNVGWLGDSALVLHGGVAAEVASVDPFGCTTCQPGWSIVATASAAQWSIATTYDGQQSPELSQAVVVGTGAAASQVTVATVYAKDGTSKPLGGACGSAVGTPFAPCMIAGRGFYPLRLHGALPYTPVAVLVSPRQGWVSCGPCTLGPDPASTSYFAAYTDAHGDATGIVRSTGIPLGRTFYAQWVVLGSLICLGGDLSNALEVQIQ